jgi:ribosomal protein S18 acetylase RimI-like enzyme
VREHAEELQACLDASADYFLRTDGAPAPAGAALDLLAEAEADTERQVLVVRPRSPAKALGLVDLYLHQPEPGVAHVGLLLLRRAAQGRGLGREVVETLERTLGQDGFIALRVSVGDENPEALGFWERLGFLPAGRLDRGITVLEKRLV